MQVVNFALMKLFTHLLSLWLLILACMPCGDRQDCMPSRQETISAKANHEQHTHEGEHCTPFCSCSCCAATSYYRLLTVTITPAVSQEQKGYADYKDPYCSEVSYAIWQPPQLS